MVRDENGIERRFSLADPPLTVGRAPDARIRLESTAVSRHHARLVVDAAGTWQVEDLASRNGTLVNGQRVTQHALARGDCIQLDSFQLTYFPFAPPAGLSPSPEVHALDATLTGAGVQLSDARAGRLATLGDLEPPRVSARHMTTLNDLSQSLLETDDA